MDELRKQGFAASLANIFYPGRSFQLDLETSPHIRAAFDSPKVSDKPLRPIIGEVLKLMDKLRLLRVQVNEKGRVTESSNFTIEG